MTTISTRKKRNQRERLRRLEAALAAGRVPTLRVYTPGAEELYKRYGIDTSNLYIPAHNFDINEGMKIKHRLRNKRRKERETII